MNQITDTLPARQLCVEAGKKAVVCFGAAIAIGAALPYSLDFAFQTVTHLGFVVALTEGAVSVVADLLDHPNLAVRKIIESVETLGASAVLAAVSLYVQLG